MVDPRTLPPAPRKLVTKATVARALGYTAGWGYRNIERLQREAGFPLAVEGTGRFDLAAVVAWQDLQMLRRHGAPRDPAPTGAPPAPANLNMEPARAAELAALMDARAERLAGGGHG
jgi:hypothetical protein